MDTTETILQVGELMLKENIITDFGFKILHNDFLSDVSVPIEPNELKKKTRICIFMVIVYNMTLLYGGYCQENNLSMEHFETLKPISLHFEETLPKILNTLSDKYLEIFHGAKVSAFVHGHKFDTYVPTHPEDQKILDTIGYKADDAQPVVINV
jgi:hypothetical protein